MRLRAACSLRRVTGSECGIKRRWRRSIQLHFIGVAAALQRYTLRGSSSSKCGEGIATSRLYGCTFCYWSGGAMAVLVVSRSYLTVPHLSVSAPRRAFANTPC